MKEGIVKTVAGCLTGIVIFNSKHAITTEQYELHEEDRRPVATSVEEHRALAGTIMQGARVMFLDTIDFD